MRGLQVFQGFSGDLQVFPGSNDSQCLRPINIFSGILEPIGHNGLDMRRGFSFSNWAKVQGHVSHDPVAKDVHCANGLVPGQHIAATPGHYLQAGLQMEKEMFHEDNIVAAQELAMATEMFQEDNIVVTQKLFAPLVTSPAGPKCPQLP